MSAAMENTLTGSEEARKRLLERIRRDCGPTIMKALDDPKVIEIMVNPDGRIWLDVAGEGMRNTGATILPAAVASILGVSASMLNTVVTRESPILEGEFPLDGSRLEGLIPPLVPAPSFALRRKASMVFTLEQYVERGIMTAAQAEGIKAAVKQHQNILIIGGTSSGKTTLTNAVLREVAELCPEDRLVTIEDTNELQIEVENNFPMRTSEAAPISRCLRAAMRLRPDRIVVGELRGGEAYTLLKAWNSGHPGGVTTLHANSPGQGLDKLVQYIFEAPEARNFSSEQVGRTISEVVDVVLFIEKADVPSRRIVREVCRVSGYRNGSFELSPFN